MADMIGKLLTVNLVDLNCDLTAINTKLIWTVIGKQKFAKEHNILTTLSISVRNVPLRELWELETIGISDPIHNF